MAARFSFCTGDEIDLARYLSLEILSATSVCVYLRLADTLHVEFASEEELLREAQRLRHAKLAGVSVADV